MARKLEVKIVGDSRGLSKTFGSASRDADKFGKQMAGVHTRVSKSFAGMTLSIAKFGAATAGLGAIGAAFTQIGKTTVGFDRSMRNVNSIAQMSEKNLGKMEKAVLRLAGKTAQAPQTLADGLYDLVSSGFKGKQAMMVLAASAKAATAGLTTTEVSTKAVAAVLNAYHRPAADAAAVSDALFQTVNLGVISFDELANTIGDVLPFASSLGIGLDQVGAAISTMTKAGISAPETMTRIKAVMVSMLKPGKDLSKAIKQTGAESGEALIKQKGFQGALEALAKVSGGSKAELAKLFPNVRALGGALALTGSNAKGADADLKGFHHTSGATDKALKQQSKSIAYQWNKVKSTISELAISAGSVLIPAFSDALDSVVGFAKDAGKAWDNLVGKFHKAKGDKAPNLHRMLGVGELTKQRSTFGAIGKVVADAFKGIDWKAIGDTMGAGISSAFNAGGKLPGLISQGLSQAFSHIDGRAVLGGLVDILGGAVDALFSPSFWIEHFKAIFSLVTIVFPIGKLLHIPGLSFLFEKISKPLFGVAKKLGTGLAKLLVSVGGDAMKGLWTGLSREFPKVTGFIGRIAGKVIGFLSGLPGKLKGIGGRAAGALAQGLGALAGRVGEAAGHLASQAVKALGKAANWMFGNGVRWVGSIIKGIGSRIGAVVQKVVGLGAKVVEVLHNLGARFVELGVNLIKGLINGIVSKAGDVANAAKNVAKGAVDGVKGFLGIKSPSKVFEGIGKNLIAGFVNGILSKKEQVAAGLNHSLLFPLDAAIAALEKKKNTLQATWDKIDAAATKRGLIGDLRRARNTPITVTGGGLTGTGGSGSGGGKAVIAGGHFLQGMGLDVGESKYFGGVTTNRHAHYKNDHYSGNSIDINAAGGGASELGKLKAALKKLKAKFGSLIQMSLIEDAGQANQHLHVTFKNAMAGASSATSSAAKSVGGKWGKIIAAASKKFGIPAAILRGLIKVESGGNINAVSSAGAFGLTQFMPATARAYGVKRGDANSQIMGAAKYLRALGFSKNAVKALNAYNGAQTIGGKTNPYAGHVIAAAQSVSGAFGFGKVTTNAKERAGSIKDARKALGDFMRDARRANRLAKIDLKIAGLERLKAFKDAIKGIRDQVKDLAGQAAAAWRGAQEAQINATHDAAIKAIGNSADAVELRGLQAQDAAEEDAKTTQDLADTKTQADQDVADAQAQLNQDGSKEYKATWQKAYDDAVKKQKDAADAIEDYQRHKRENVLADNLANATQAADDTQQTALDGLDQQEADYATSLENQLGALTTNLEKRKTTYAGWAKSVNDILNVYGLGVAVDPDTEAAVVAGPGGTPSFTGTHGAWAFGWGGQGGNPPEGKGPNGLWSWHDGKGYVHHKPKKKRALGGSVAAGESYLVGERGMEVFTPDRDGNITPNNRLGGNGRRGGDVYMTGTVNIGSQKAARALANRLAYRAQFG